MEGIRMTVDVPVEKHVKVFVENSRFMYFGKRITFCDSMGAYLVPLLDSKKRGCWYKTPEGFETLKVELLLDDHHKNKTFISIEKAKRFNKFVDGMIKDFAIETIDACINFGISKKSALEFFCEKYGLDYENKLFYMLEKHYSRTKERMLSNDSAA